MGVPGGPSAGREVDGPDVDLGVAPGLDDRVDPHVAGEPVGWAFDGRRLRFDSHCSSCVVVGQRWSALSACADVGVVANWREDERFLRAASGWAMVYQLSKNSRACGLKKMNRAVFGARAVGSNTGA